MLVSGKYAIEVDDHEGKAVRVACIQKKENQGSNDKNKDYGVYFIRTSFQKPMEAQLWKICNIIREVEATFSCLKSNLQIRPIHHQNDTRAEAHNLPDHTYLPVGQYHTLHAENKGNKSRLGKYRHNHENANHTERDHTHSNKNNKPSQTFSSKKISIKIYEATNTNSIIPTKKKYFLYH